MPVHIHVTLGNAKTNQVTNDLTSKEDNPVYSNNPEQVKTKQDSPDSLAILQRNMTKVAFMQAGREVINYATNNISKYTGNSRIQTRVNNAREAINLGIDYAQTAIMVGPVVASITTGLKTVTQVATTIADQQFEIRWDNRRSKQDMQRAGYNNLREVVGRRK